ncbi:dihydrolipoyl dehydrogenase [Nocardioides alcanivorans]|uniref:dihydrolipoyl dehydrogenase n=1 Tax=Nocardioides alcanivorans TaxID=2897352 RepID=UPI001F33B08D
MLGAGSGGYSCALRAAQLGLTVVLIEADKVGGTCLHVGCIPTKALLHAAEVADATREAATFGVRARFDGIDMAGVHAYKDGVVSRLFKGLEGLVKARGITVVRGRGRLTSPTTVEVDGTTLTAPAIVLATGSHSRGLPGLQIDGERVLDSEQALRLDRVPASVVVLGGGVIGAEFASVWRSFGAEVTIIEALPRLLAAEDEASSKLVERTFRKRGIRSLTSTRFQAVELTESGVKVTAGDQTLEADVLLVAVGRAPSTEDIGLAEAGVATDRGFVTADSRCRTNVPGIFAVGDIVPGLQLAHRGFQQGIFVAEEIAGLSPHRSPRPTSRASPTATPKSPPWGSARPRPRPSTAPIRWRA